MNNKGQFDVARKTIYWMMISVVIIALVFGFAIIYSSFKERVTTVDPLVKSELVISTLLYNTDCLAYKDEQGIYQRGVIDLEKFTDQTLAQCYNKSRKDINLRFKIDDKEIRTPNYYHHDYLGQERKILVYDGQEIKLKNLSIFIQKNV